MAYIFGSIWNRSNRNALNELSKSIEYQGKSIQNLVAKGQLTPEQYATLIQVVNGLVSKGELSVHDINKNLGKFDGTWFTSQFLSQLQGGTINTTNVLPRSITTLELADHAVTAGKIGLGAVESARIGDNAVTAEKIRFSAVENVKIAPKAVTGSKIEDATIQERSLIDKSIGGEKLKNGAIGIDQLEDVVSDFNNFSTNPIFQDGKLMSVEEYKGSTLIKRTKLNYGTDNTVNSVVTEIPNKKMTTALSFQNNILSNVKNTVSTGGL